MTLDHAQIQALLCKALCADVRVHAREDDRLLVETPFSFPDGDRFSLFLEGQPGGVRVTDLGQTLMHLSYEEDIDKLRNGTRARLLDRILSEARVSEDDGAFFVDVTPDEIPGAVFRLGQTLTRIHDLSFLKRSRVESTFYEDLERAIEEIVPGKVTKDFLLPIQDAENYKADFKIESKGDPLFLFGIPSRDKARLTTIVLQHFVMEKVAFDSLLVFADQKDIPRPDLARLSNVGGEMVASLDAREDLERKLRKKAA
ncbi:MAG: DUF1828 domain-containing protein [Deltaproteobacteria bacterium]